MPAYLMSPALLRACQIVGKTYGISFEQSGATLEDTVWAARCRLRWVALRDDWWRKDSGALLGFWQDNPVALLPSRRGYLLLQNNVTRRVTPDIAHQISLHAVTFYPLLPDSSLTFLRVVRFGFTSTRGAFYRLLLTTLFMNGVLLALQLLAGTLYENGLRAASSSLYFILLFVGSIVLVLLSHTQSVALLQVHTRLESLRQAALWERLLRTPIMPLMDEAVRLIPVISALPLLHMMLALLSALTALLLLTWLHQPIAWLSIFMILGLTFIFVPLVTKYYRHWQQAERTNFRFIRQIVRNIAKIKVAGAEKSLYDRWHTISQEYQAQRRAIEVFASGLRVGYVVFSVFIGLTIFSLLPQLSGGAMIASLIAWYQLTQALFTFMGILPNLAIGLVAWQQLEPLLNTLPETNRNRRRMIELKGAIEVRAISYGALRDISLSVAAGECVAITGAAGTGKSTLLRLLAGLISPEQGSIFYDHQDSSTLDWQVLRQHIGMVLESSDIHAGSVLSNIVGVRQLPIEAAWEAARLAGLDTFIQSMAMGMHTLLDEGGAVLSQGQRQRLLLARALAGKPRLLLLDDATSALDPITEMAVLRHLATLNITRVIVTQRQNILSYADKVVVLHASQPVQVGTYAEMMQQSSYLTERMNQLS